MRQHPPCPVDARMEPGVNGREGGPVRQAFSGPRGWAQTRPSPDYYRTDREGAARTGLAAAPARTVLRTRAPAREVNSASTSLGSPPHIAHDRTREQVHGPPNAGIHQPPRRTPPLNRRTSRSVTSPARPTIATGLLITSSSLPARSKPRRPASLYSQQLPSQKTP
jgi:hypothetical protein